jgi:hypothetical protein
MSKVLEDRSPVALIAAQLLEDAEQGVRSYNVKFGSQIEKEILASGIVAAPERKTNLKAWVLLTAFCVVGIYYGLEYSKNKVTGFAVDGKSGLLMFDSTVVFHNMENAKQYMCKTNKRGNFNTRLPSGNYKFWVKDHGSLETAKVQVTVDGESNYRVTSFKK